jgi:hypothetical protein
VVPQQGEAARPGGAVSGGRRRLVRTFLFSVYGRPRRRCQGVDSRRARSRDAPSLGEALERDCGCDCRHGSSVTWNRAIGYIDQDERAEIIALENLLMAAAAYSAIVWAGMLLVLLGFMVLAGYVERATESGGRGLWLHLVLLVHAVVVGLIATAVLYSLYVTDIAHYVWSRLLG